jgi:hypothetical protein
MNGSRLAGMAILLAGQLLCAGQGRADSWQQAASFRVSTEHDSNPAMSATNRTGIWRALFEPSYALTGRTGESEITAGLALQMVRSSDKTLSPSQDNPSVFLNWLRPSEAGEFGISSRYAQAAIRDAGGVDATGRVSAASTSKTRTLSGRWSKELSERSTLSADTAYSGVTYNGGIYTDYSTRSGGLKIGYVSSEQITSFCSVTGNKYLPANNGPSSSLASSTLGESTLAEATFGMDWRGEYIVWTVQAGKARVSGSNSETLGSVAAHYTGQQTQLTMNAGRTITASGLGGFIKSNQVLVNWSYALSDYSNTGLDLAGQKNLSFTIGPDTSTTLGAWINHDLTSAWKVRTYYQHRTSRGGGFESASSNLVGLSFAYSYSDF